MNPSGPRAPRMLVHPPHRPTPRTGMTVIDFLRCARAPTSCCCWRPPLPGCRRPSAWPWPSPDLHVLLHGVRDHHGQQLPGDVLNGDVATCPEQGQRLHPGDLLPLGGGRDRPGSRPWPDGGRGGGPPHRERGPQLRTYSRWTPPPTIRRSSGGSRQLGAAGDRRGGPRTSRAAVDPCRCGAPRGRPGPGGPARAPTPSRTFWPAPPPGRRPATPWRRRARCPTRTAPPTRLRELTHAGAGHPPRRPRPQGQQPRRGGGRRRPPGGPPAAHQPPVVSVDNPPRCVVVMQPTRGEGKVHRDHGHRQLLLAHVGEAAVIVDADLRRPTVAGSVRAGRLLWDSRRCCQV
ncbi:hypothetical protein QJS66_07560 [Kocuria rhizophila]|nr:hypothetical protein QJS66_07560 [Kocuria rhizophila]